MIRRGISTALASIENAVACSMSDERLGSVGDYASLANNAALGGVLSVFPVLNWAKRGLRDPKFSADRVGRRFVDSSRSAERSGVRKALPLQLEGASRNSVSI
jgi:hypothetical protein